MTIDFFFIKCELHEALEYRTLVLNLPCVMNNLICDVINIVLEAAISTKSAYDKKS